MSKKRFAPLVRFGLRTKLTLLIESLVVILVVVTGIITTMREKETLEDELRKRGFALAMDVAKFTARPLLSNDLPTLRRFVNHSMEQDYVRYVVVLDTRGRVVMHSDLEEVGKVYHDQVDLAAMEASRPGYLRAKLPKNGEHYYDIFTPIEVDEVRLGTVRLGYSYMAVEKEIANAFLQIFVIGVVTIFIGGIAAYVLASFISAPIGEITEATGKVAAGDLTTRLAIRRKDEIGTLASSFNKMTEDLRRTTISKDYMDNIIGSMNDTLVVLDGDGKIGSVNKAACDLLGYREEELIGNEFKSIVLPEEKIITSRGFARLLARKRMVNYEIDYVTKQGQKVPMLFSAGVLEDKKKEIVGVVGIARDITERRQAEEALRQSERELRYLSTQLLTAQEKERRRLSVELHDELGQALMVLKLKVRAIQRRWGADENPLREECDQVIAYINEVTENVRRLSRDLSPSILEDLGLAVAIGKLAESSPVPCRIESGFEMTEMDELFSAGARITVYRILQECLTNIARHARADRIRIGIVREESAVLFSIEDNGRGFDLQEALGRGPSRKGVGLSAMNERVRMLGGSLDIVSEPGGGTRISFTVPLNEESDRETVQNHTGR